MGFVYIARASSLLPSFFGAACILTRVYTNAGLWTNIIAFNITFMKRNFVRVNKEILKIAIRSKYVTSDNFHTRMGIKQKLFNE
ncbi:hypothetical protein B0T20DRAFT_206176 [Sordaria brevicollis]|uniref:Uncharacterized protein n=1 Tax=Sordaria brevicollis TaxID=83679 RepID=A0AAE0UC57_SORBR|nr:hypothetical protein B0T20DRAFT_206176 [Sordaria brevicollis]